jgi:predicted TIM-barrel fold metal-dependent hydrolase
LANLVEHSAAEDPDLVVAIVHALNRWMLDQWGYTHENRLFMTPVISCALVEEARRELEYVVENGAKAVLIKPAPVKGYRGWRSPALPEFDPFWSDVQDAGIPVMLHASQPPLDDYVSRWEPPSNYFQGGAFRWMALGHREISDMIASLICHGTLTRFPNLRIASIENGSSWIKHLFEDFEGMYSKMPQAFEEHPLDVFRRNIWVSPFWEGSVEEVVSTVGWDRVLFGSDYPHPEGLAEPKDYYKYAEGMTEDRTRDFMGDNARRLMGVPVRSPSASGHSARS